MSQVTSAHRAPVLLWRTAVAALFAALLVLSGHEVGLGTDPAAGQWVQAALCTLITVPVAVHAWRTRSPFAALLALGAALWTFGSAWYAGFLVDAADPPFPSPADAGYLGAAVAFSAATMVVLRRNVAGWEPSLWLDGLVAAFVAAAVGAAVVLPTVDTGSTDALAVATNVAYPLMDVLLLGAIAGGWVVTGARPARTWRWLVAGILVLAATDIEFLLLVASGDWVLGGIDDLGWPLALLLLGRAALAHEEELREPRRLDARRVPVVPFLCAAVAVALLLVDHWVHLDPYGVVLAGVAVVLAAVRTAVALRTNVRLLDSERQALTDELTGLGNRRRLLRDLGRVERGTVALFDLDGFKTYNDAYGHLAGDALLTALGARVAEATDGHGSAYRLGGDEFCVLVTACDVDHALVLDRALDALRQEGDGFSVGASYGTVRVPEEAARPEDALQLADTRMYAQKEGRRSSTRRQSRDLLLQLLHEQQPDLEEHSGDVGDLVAAVGARLGMGEEALDHARHAAELHDVGKVAIPASILRKPGPLDEQEWVLMKRHTIIGERILAAVPALVPVGRIVRATHERWDGGGYPDGLRGEEIPLAARVIAVCDTFHAITTDRPYRAGQPAAEALAELRRCAGTQFDAAVVEAFAEELADGATCALPGRGAADAGAAVAAAEAVAPRQVAPAGAVASAAAGELARLAQLRGLLEVSRLARHGADVADVLDAVGRTISTSLGFRIVTTNLLRPAWDDFVCTAVEGPDDVRELLLGRARSSASWEPFLDPRFARGRTFFVPAGSVAFDDDPDAEGWHVPDIEARDDDPNAWHPDDVLVVPLRAPDGTILGMVGVDEPVWGRRPTDAELEVLAAVCEHAALAVDAARQRADERVWRGTRDAASRLSRLLAGASGPCAVADALAATVRECLHFGVVEVEVLADEVAAADAEALLARGEVELEAVLLAGDAAARARARRALPRSTSDGRGPHAWRDHVLATPVRGADGELLAVLWLGDPGDRLLPSLAARGALRDLAHQTAVALAWAQRAEAVSASALGDLHIA